VESFKNLVKNDNVKKAQIYMNAFWHNEDLNLFKRWFPGVGLGHNRENCFYTCLSQKNIFKIFSRTTGLKKLKFTLKLPDIVQKQVYKRRVPWRLGGAKIFVCLLLFYVPFMNFSHIWRPHH
jgi:hypothetical protein